MYNLKRRRESVATVYRKTTKFLSSNTANFLRRSNARKYNLLDRIVKECENNEESEDRDEEDDDDDFDLGERDLDYYLGVRQKETYWRDLEGQEQIRKDFLLYHCGVSEEDYELHYKKSTVSHKRNPVQPRLKQVPFKIHKKNKKINSFKESVNESWIEKKGIFKLFGNKRESDTSDSYSDCDSNDDTKGDKDDMIWEITEKFGGMSTIDALNKLLGVRIKEVSEGRPCDNCPELCPGFISHPWSFTLCPACGKIVRDNLCLRHSVLHFPPYFGDVECNVAELKLTLSCFQQRNEDEVKAYLFPQ